MNGIVSCVTGRVGTAPDFKYSASGNPFLTFSLAADDTKRAEGDPTEWVRVACFGEIAEQLNGKLAKGSRLYAEGRLRLEQWTAKTGEQRSTLKLAAWLVTPMGVESRRPRTGQQAEPPRRPNAMPQRLAVAGGRDTRQALGLDDGGDLDDTSPF